MRGCSVLEHFLPHPFTSSPCSFLLSHHFGGASNILHLSLGAITYLFPYPPFSLLLIISPLFFSISPYMDYSRPICLVIFLAMEMSHLLEGIQSLYIVGAAAASSSSSQQSLDSSSFAFPKFRDVWKEKNLTSEVLNLVGACSSARDACETVQVTNERKKRYISMSQANFRIS